LAGLAYAVDDLLAAERLRRAGPLDDRQARGLHRREPPVALRALAAPTDRRAVVRGPGVDHPGVPVPAEGAVHASSSAGGSDPSRQACADSRLGVPCHSPDDGDGATPILDT